LLGGGAEEGGIKLEPGNSWACRDLAGRGFFALPIVQCKRPLGGTADSLRLIPPILVHDYGEDAYDFLVETIDTQSI
jgi:hypothetical protein